MSLPPRLRRAQRAHSLSLFGAATLLALACSCGGGDGGGAATSDGGQADADGSSAGAQPEEQVEYDIDIPLVTYAWDPQAGDASVSAEMGGPGFTGEGWTTNMTFPALGAADAVPGGQIIMSRPDWPATLRMTGKDWNTDLTYTIRDLCYESLLLQHPLTREFVPRLATHWQILDDGMRFRYRINPEARFANGEELTAHDVVASYKLRMDPSTLDPSSILTFEKMEEPVAVSKYILEVRCKEQNWRNFLYFSEVAMTVFPASQVDITGSDYLETFQFKMASGSGPYEILDEDIDIEGETLVARRRDDWWAKDNPAWTGLYNFDSYRWIVIRDQITEFEKFKNGEFDFFVIGRAQWYAEEIPTFDTWQRGMMRRLKIYNGSPRGTGGFAINTTRAPLDDLRVRHALAQLWPREHLLSQFMFNEYEPLNSNWPGGDYENPNNQLIEYDPFGAVEKLEAAGWTELDEDGVRVKDGQRLQLSIQYSVQQLERYLTVFQESCTQAGIELELQLLTPTTRWQNMRERRYELSYTSWGAIDPPNPETMWHSRMAAEVDNNNVTAFADPRVDALCEEYDTCDDARRRRDIVREIDGIIHEQIHYVQSWYRPAERVVLWNRFGMPEWGANYVWDYKYMHMSWWIDQELDAELEACRADDSRSMERGPEVIRFYDAWKAAQQD